jgi:hypothetical protein
MSARKEAHTTVLETKSTFLIDTIAARMFPKYSFEYGGEAVEQGVERDGRYAPAR